MLRTRVISAAILLVLLAPVVWWGGTVFTLGVTLVGALAAWEMTGLMRATGGGDRREVLFALAVGLPATALWDGSLALVPPFLTFVILVSLSGELWRSGGGDALRHWGLSVAGGLYIGLLLAHFPAVRLAANGLAWLLVALACTWVCDSAAYMVGTWVGRHPFASHISPHKTWEGTIAGILAALLTGWVIVPLMGVAMWQAPLIGMTLGVAAVVGDLVESFIKRQAGVKDSGRIIPGHGGVLDRIDSLLFTIPCTYYLSLLVQ
jgi:phosphatidate cytidylyltransferase